RGRTDPRRTVRRDHAGAASPAPGAPPLPGLRRGDRPGPARPAPGRHHGPAHGRAVDHRPGRDPGRRLAPDLPHPAFGRERRMSRDLRPGGTLPATRYQVEVGPMRVCSALMADPSPIHYDAEFVARIGRGDRPINQGTLTIAYLVN